MRSGKVKQLTKGSNRQTIAPPDMTAQTLNQHYATISSDSIYQATMVKVSCLAQQTHITEWEVFKLLDYLQPTATGVGLVPAWFLRLTASVFATPIV